MYQYSEVNSLYSLLACIAFYNLFNCHFSLFSHLLYRPIYALRVKISLKFKTSKFLMSNVSDKK